MSAEAKLHFDPMRGCYVLMIWERRGDHDYLATIGEGGAIMFTAVEIGQHCQPTFVFPRGTEILQSLAAELQNHHIGSVTDQGRMEATKLHLDDMRAQNGRMLDVILARLGEK